jgi:diguanylate cyclase (GGDEF)-like protein
VADAYDTLRGARPYRPAVSRKEACAALRRESGRKFDPRLVKLFLDNLEYFEAEIFRQGLGYRRDHGEALSVVIGPAGPVVGFVEQIKLANREASTLYELAREFSSSLDLAETLSLFTEKIREFVPFESCSVFLIDEKTGIAKSVHNVGDYQAEFIDREIRVGEGVTGQVLENKNVARNYDPSLEFENVPGELGSHYRSMVCLPLLADEQLIGAVSLYSCGENTYGEEHERLLETITRIASDAILKSHRHAEAENFALTDPMTGLPNARSLQIQFERESARALRAGTSFQLLMLDLDGFKLVNDTFGHKAGDRMLTEVGRIIHAQLREYDFLARYAGDEFVAIVPESTTDSVFDLCRRIEQSVRDFELPVGDDIAKVGVSVGSASFPHAGNTFDQLLVAADKAMYSAKVIRKQNERYRNLASHPKIPVTVATEAPASELPAIVDDENVLIEIDESHIFTAAVN